MPSHAATLVAIHQTAARDRTNVGKHRPSDRYPRVRYFLAACDGENEPPCQGLPSFFECWSYWLFCGSGWLPRSIEGQSLLICPIRTGI